MIDIIDLISKFNCDNLNIYFHSFKYDNFGAGN